MLSLTMSTRADLSSLHTLLHGTTGQPFNERLVGGGARSHEPLRALTVEVLQRNPPIMTDIPENFEITDELYRAELNLDAHANILAIGRSHETLISIP